MLLGRNVRLGIRVVRHVDGWPEAGMKVSMIGKNVLEVEVEVRGRMMLQVRQRNEALSRVRLGEKREKLECELKHNELLELKGFQQERGTQRMWFEVSWRKKEWRWRGKKRKGDKRVGDGDGDGGDAEGSGRRAKWLEGLITVWPDRQERMLRLRLSACSLSAGSIPPVGAAGGQNGGRTHWGGGQARQALRFGQRQALSGQTRRAHQCIGRTQIGCGGYMG